MISFLLLGSFAFASDLNANVVVASLPTRSGAVGQGLLIGLIDPPEPDADPPSPDIDPPNPDRDSLTDPPEPDADPPQPDRDGLSEPPNPDVDPPSPDFDNDGLVAHTTLAFDGSSEFALVLALSDKGAGVESVSVREGKEGTESLVWGKGSAESDLPPGPCFTLVVRMVDGTELDVDVALAVEGGALDLEDGALIGLLRTEAPEGFGAAVELDFGALAREAAVLSVDVSMSSKGGALKLY